MDDNMIGGRDPWELMRRASDHISDRMSTIRSLWAWDVSPSVTVYEHSSLCDANCLIHDKVMVVMLKERYPKVRA